MSSQYIVARVFKMQLDGEIAYGFLKSTKEHFLSYKFQFPKYFKPSAVTKISYYCNEEYQRIRGEYNFFFDLFEKGEIEEAMKIPNVEPNIYDTEIVNIKDKVYFKVKEREN